MSKIIPFTILSCILLEGSVYGLAPKLSCEEGVGMKYHYYSKCTCGVLLEIHETNNPKAAGTISHGLCDKCYVDLMMDAGIPPKEHLIQEIRDRIAKAQIQLNKLHISI